MGGKVSTTINQIDCIHCAAGGLKETLQAIVDSGEMHNLLFSGGPGCGKTTAAIAMCKEMGAEYIKINCSEDGNIDTLRTRIRDFATSQSLTGDKKVVILDEFDYANANSFQPALRGFIEEFSVKLSLCSDLQLQESNHRAAAFSMHLR